MASFNKRVTGFLLLLLLYSFLLLQGFHVDGFQEDISLTKNEELEIENELQRLTKPAVKTVKIYTTALIFYKQPAFDNPLLKNHKYHPGMRPLGHRSVSERLRGNTRSKHGQVKLEPGVHDAFVAAADGSDVISVRSRELDWRVKPPDKRVIIAAVAAAVLVVVGVVAYLYYIAFRASPPVPPLDQPLPSSSPAGPPVEIEMFPISTVGTSRPEFSHCAICLDELEEGEVFRTFPCRHVIHDACLARGLSVPGTFRFCPHCRAELV